MSYNLNNKNEKEKTLRLRAKKTVLTSLNVLRTCSHKIIIAAKLKINPIF